jgi:hypothetical protein
MLAVMGQRHGVSRLAAAPLSVLIVAIRLYQSQWACWRVALVR